VSGGAIDWSPPRPLRVPDPLLENDSAEINVPSGASKPFLWCEARTGAFARRRPRWLFRPGASAPVFARRPVRVLFCTWLV